MRPKPRPCPASFRPRSASCPHCPRCKSSTARPWRRPSRHWPSASRRVCTCPVKGSWTTANCWQRCCCKCSRSPPAPAGQPARVIDCRGLGAKPQWPALRGVRGEVARVHAPDVTLQRPTRLVHPRYPIYIAPKQDHLFGIGATEIESDELAPVSVRSTLELLSAAYAVHPGFAEGRILELAAQCRPTLADNLPAIRQPRKGLLQIKGLYRHGFMIAPALLDVTLQLLHTGQSALAQDFDLALDMQLQPPDPLARPGAHVLA